jgi:transcriptional regulator with XRE-family HTH domain
MPVTRKATTDAVEILHRRFYKGNPGRLKSLAECRANDEIARKIRTLRTKAGLTQAQLASLVGTTASVICRLEDADYEGHSVAMLRRIAAALKQRFAPFQVGLAFLRSEPRRTNPNPIGSSVGLVGSASNYSLIFAIVTAGWSPFRPLTALATRRATSAKAIPHPRASFHDSGLSARTGFENVRVVDFVPFARGNLGTGGESPELRAHNSLTRSILRRDYWRNETDARWRIRTLRSFPSAS